MKTKVLTLIFVIFVSTLPVKFTSLSDLNSYESTNYGCNADRNETWTVGLIYCTNEMQEGYTLFSPMASNTSYLIDEFGREVHHWISPGDHRPGLSAYLLDNGSLLRTANLGQNQPGEFSGGGSAGKVEMISWDGDLEWSWTYSSEMYRSHHDIEPLPNGNFLMIAWEYRSESEAAEAGKYPQDDSSRAVTTSTVWPDKIIEVKPIGLGDAIIVWEWTFWDHLIQDYDSSKANYGVVSDHPELLDVNYIDAAGSASGGRDWLHCNGIDYNEILDQIAISCKNTNEIYIIDHSTTTEEAAGHSGGNSGKGGDILYRYGNPESYQRGGPDEQVLFAQHDVQWIKDGYPDAGKLMIFNNGKGRDIQYSSVDVIETPIDGYTYYIDKDEPFGPENLSWSWDNGIEMYSSAISGSTRLSNGNTLMTFGIQGTFIEVDYTGKIVWKYISPVNDLGIMTQGDSIFTSNGNKVFKVSRHSPMHPALIDRDLSPHDYIENWQDNCPDIESLPYDVDGDGCIDDSDSDGIDDSADLCWGFDDNVDQDDDEIPDGCDLLIDSDDDNIADEEDKCPGHDDNIDVDNDSISDGCDDLIDSDRDGISNQHDLCPGYDDLIDFDNDSIPDGCDNIIDSDQDGIDDDNDLCPGFNDTIDLDLDLIPDGCDDIVTEENNIDDSYDDSNRIFTAQNISLGLVVILFVALLFRRKSSG